jgi:sterol 3beta-glucosyltransferase
MATNGVLPSPRPNGGQTIGTEDQDPASEDYCGNVNINTDGSNLEAQVTHDGRVDIRFGGQALKLSKRFHTPARWSAPKQDGEFSPIRDYEATFQELLNKYSAVPRLNIAIHIVGSRGDVQPFIAIGQCLMAPPCGHRVRICTHPVFKDFVEENGLEFFSIGGDPNSLMAYMVKNPGLFPGKDSWKSGEVGKRRSEFAVILDGCWRSCIEPGNGMGDETQTAQSTEGQTIMEDNRRHFIADAIIANPPSYGHIHCAEKLGIPLHMMFTYAPHALNYLVYS